MRTLRNITVGSGLVTLGLLALIGLFALPVIIQPFLGYYTALAAFVGPIAIMFAAICAFFQDSREIYCPEEDGWGEVCAPEGGQVN